MATNKLGTLLSSQTTTQNHQTHPKTRRIHQSVNVYDPNSEPHLAPEWHLEYVISVNDSRQTDIWLNSLCQEDELFLATDDYYIRTPGVIVKSDFGDLAHKISYCFGEVESIWTSLDVHGLMGAHNYVQLVYFVSRYQTRIALCIFLERTSVSQRFSCLIGPEHEM